jgi:hypothetical protein
MNLVILGILVAVIAAPTLLSMVLTRVSKVLYSGPATVVPLSIRPNRDGMYQVTIAVPEIAPFIFEVSASRFARVMDGENTVMVSVARRLLDSKTVIDQILWKYEAKKAAKDGRYDKISPDRPVDQDLGLVPGLLYFALSMVSVLLFAGDNFVSALMRSDPLLMHAFWYGNAACVTLCGYWVALKQPAIRGNLSEGGSRWLLMVLYSIIGSCAALATFLFYEEPSPLMLLGAMCASAVGILLAMITGAFRSHPSAASPIVGLDVLSLRGSSRKDGEAARLLGSATRGRDQNMFS